MISVIIPIYNSEKTIIETLKGLEDQSRDDFEVIVVDDGSTDNSRDVVLDYITKSGWEDIRMLRQENNSGPARARNLGAHRSRGDIIIFLDSDCIPPQNWIEEMVTPLGGDIAGCNCAYRVKNSESMVARYVDYEISKRHERLIGKRINTIGSYSASFIKEVFEKAGGFDTDYTAANAEDFDLGFKIQEMGYHILFTNNTFVYHYHPDSLKEYLKQQYTRGYWRVKMYLRNKKTIFKGDSYTGYEAQVQFPLSCMVLLSVPLMLKDVNILILSLGLLFFSNISLGLWALKKEKKMFPVSIFIASFRSIAGSLGAFGYIIKNGLK